MTTDFRTPHRVPAEQLTAHCDPGTLAFATTDDLAPLEAVFGQERAVRAIEFALGMGAPGYNLYAAGPDGLGKSTVVQAFLKRRAARMPAPRDWVYVHNFTDPDRPVAISLPSGEGHEFARAVAETAQRAASELHQTFDSDSYARQRQELARTLEGQRGQLLQQLTALALEIGFALQVSPQGIVSAPVVDGHALDDATFAQLPEPQRASITAATVRLDTVVQEAMLRMRALERETLQHVQRLDEQVAAFAIDHHFPPLTERWGADTEAAQFLAGVRADLAHGRNHFRGSVQQPPPDAPTPAQQEAALLHRYEVNVLVSHMTTGGAPVIVEGNPTYQNLVGRIEYRAGFGTMGTDHTMVRPGSLLRANGGYLVLRVRNLLTNAQSYDGLKRALTQRAVAIENLSEVSGLQLMPTTGLRPEPIPLNVKVVVIGDGGMYGELYRLDPDFRELFRVKADFDTDFERTPENIAGLASVVRAQCDLGGLQRFTAGAVARLIEYRSRTVQDQRRLSGDMASFADVIRQSAFWAEQDGATETAAKHVDRALEESEYRSALLRDRMQMLIDDGSIFIATSGSAVGQINALSVYDLGDISFGRPSRITCVTAAGNGTIVNVEHETAMAGPIHNKGFLIIRGFLADRFGQARSVTLHASMTFEQLYGQIDGDSASSTELYALLSALSEAPLAQGIAVTGSVNQRGEVQPIGGATAKIEGFFEVCRARGLDGTQGVIIPRANVPNVVLKPEVAAAIANGTFHVWAVTTVEEGIEVLTGLPAGQRDADGHYPEGSVFRRAEDRLDGYFHALQTHHDGLEAGVVRGVMVTPPAPPPPFPGMPPAPPPLPPVRV